MKKGKPEEILEEYLNERTIPDDPELASLSRVADRLERGLKVEAPEARRERALFIQGVAARKTGFPWMRLMVPVTVASMLVAFVAIGREAGPGDALYSVRKALSKVGVAQDPAREARPLLDDAEALIAKAESQLDIDALIAARQSAQRALPLLADAEEFLQDGSGELREEGLDRLADLRDDANDIIEESIEEIDDREEAQERLEERLEDARERSEKREDNSGKGGGGDSGGDDNSGSGSGGDSDDDDNSGSGSGDDSGGDDSSGSGSGGDNSGSGSDDN